MTLENIFSQVGIPPVKQLTDRYSEYPSQTHEQHIFYPYEPAPQSHVHVATSKHHYKGGHKNKAAMSALTLLAFLFFLHILQQCLRDHMTAMSTPQVMIMSSSKEGDENIGKKLVKIDKSGLTNTDKDSKYSDLKNTVDTETNSGVENNEKYLTKLSTSEYTPKDSVNRYKTSNIYTNQDSKENPNRGHGK